MESNGKSGSGGGGGGGGANHNINNNCDNEHHELVEEEEEEEGQEGNSNLSDDEEEDEDDGSRGGEIGNNTGREESPRSTTRTPFTALSQIDADHALARTLQEQERAYMMLGRNNEGSDYGSWEAGSYLHDDDFDDQHYDTRVGNNGDEDNSHAEHQSDTSDADDDDDDDDDDAFDVHAHAEFDAAEFSSDEAFARALQDAEEREMAARLLALAGIRDGEAEYTDDHRGNSQDTWEEVDPGELSYEELLALGEVVGTESRGLSADTISSLPSIKYKLGSSQNGSNDSCVICREDFEDGETLTILSCKHIYHSECINNWLNINKVCPVCSAEVSTSGHS